MAGAGYWTEDNLTAPGPDRLIAPGKSGDLPSPGQDLPPLPEDADAASRMIYRLTTPEGAARYKRRGATVEPVNGHHKMPCSWQLAASRACGYSG